MFICLHLNEKLQPKHRFPLEDMIDDVLKKNQLGEVSGGGTLMEKNGEVKSCDIDIEFSGDDDAFEWFKGYINSLNIAKGSELEIDGGKKVPVGSYEGMGIYLSVDLPDEVYENNDVNDLIEKLRNAVGEKGVFRSWCEHNEFTALYFYGSSFDELKKLAEPILNTHPLAEECRVIRTA